MKPLTDLPLISRLSNRVIRILGCNPGHMTLQGTNTYLVGTGTRRILIDAGEKKTAEEYTKVLCNVLEEEKATIEHLIITHWHHDHLGGANSVYNLVKSMNPTGTSIIWKLPRSIEDKGTSEEEKSTNWQPLTDKQIVEVEDERALFSGDCILGERTAIFEDLYSYMKSLEKMLALKPEVIYPGHGIVIKDAIASINFYIQHRLKRENDILGVLKENSKTNTLTEMDIVKHIYLDTSNIMWEAAAYNIQHHLYKLLKEGKVKGEKGKWQSL
ncbi:endoribonuclease LACTB2 isoform X2 [Colletes gigas]|uniref:endoribonuclease LACTB2 isoform X2 n=1 Tax=Colletes gigas TaxID=935657 RepID=UPI001C9B7BCE|nr:endoribonuclease LACTB2 isoform X2 [Colletes gigas]